MNKFIRAIITITLVHGNMFLIPLSLAGQNERASEASKKFLASKNNILFDVTNSRGGNGDVSAAYLTARDFLDRYQYPHHPIVFLVDDEAKKILSTLLNIPITDGTSAFNGKIKFYDKVLPENHPPVDLYLQLSAHDGIIKDKFKKFYSTDAPASSEKIVLRKQPEQIPIHKNSILLTQTIFGAGEVDDPLWMHGTIHMGDSYFRMLPAGIGKYESGIYYDPVANELGKMSSEEKRAKGMQYIGEITDIESRENILSVLEKKKLMGANWGLVYGVLESKQEKQLEIFMQGLLRGAENEKKSFVLLSPQAFDPSMLSHEIRKNIHVIVPGDTLPDQAKPGVIYILNTGKIPHPAFTSLLALSEIPPVIEGNATLSAALQLRRTFVLTQTSWTSQDISSLGSTIRNYIKNRMANSPQALELIGKIFPTSEDRMPNLEDSLRLNRGLYPKIFAELKDGIPIFTEELLTLARHSQEVVNGTAEAIRIAQSTSDHFFRADALSYASRNRDVFATQRLHQIIKSLPTEQIPIAISDLQFILADPNSDLYKTYIKRFREYLSGSLSAEVKENFLHQISLRIFEKDGKNIFALEKFIGSITKDSPLYPGKTIIAGLLLQYYPAITKESSVWLKEELRNIFSNEASHRLLFNVYSSRNIHDPKVLEFLEKVSLLIEDEKEYRKLIAKSMAWSIAPESMSCRVGYKGLALP